MKQELLPFLLLIGSTISGAAAQNPRAGGFGGTRPPTDNERGLRRLTPEEIPPNLNFYAMDPLYDPNAVPGWSETRIEEKLNRGMLALAMGDGKVYLGWRLLKNDPQSVAFNIYRSTAGTAPVKLNEQPIVRTTDFVDDKASLDQPNTWSVRPVVEGREVSPVETQDSASLPTNAPVRQYTSFPLRDDIRGVAMVGIADLDGDGVYDFVVKHPGGGKDPGRAGHNRGSYKYDGYRGRTGQFL